MILVPEDEVGPGFAYTVGLTETFGHPELLVQGLPLDVAHAVLNNGGEEVRRGVRFGEGSTTTELLEDFTCGFRLVPRQHYREYFGAAKEHYGHGNFLVLQVLWPDAGNRLPGDPRCGADTVSCQELLSDVA